MKTVMMALHEAPEAKVGSEPEEKKQELTADEVFTSSQVEVDTEEPSTIPSSVVTEQVEKLGSRNVSMLMDVELKVTVELGRKLMTIAEILNLGKGAVIELAKAAGEPLDIYVNGTRMAKGEVVVIDEQFAVRITDLASPKERIKSLA